LFVVRGTQDGGMDWSARRRPQEELAYLVLGCWLLTIKAAPDCRGCFSHITLHEYPFFELISHLVPQALQ